MSRRRHSRRSPTLVALGLLFASCGRAGAESAPGVDPATLPSVATPSTSTAPATSTAGSPPRSGAPTTTARPSTTVPPASTTTASTVAAASTSTTTPTTTSTTTTSSTTSSTSTTTTEPLPTTTLPPLPPLPDPALPASNAAFDRLAATNAAASMTVVRDGVIRFSRASGTTIGGDPATADSPMIVASVSKVVTAVAIARLAQQGAIGVGAPVPWAELGLAPHPAWNDVTVRELLDHRSGMPVARASWFEQPGDCRSHLPRLLAAPPESSRGRWRYSNGNYCALGLLVEQRTGLALDEAAQQLVFDPLGIGGAHLTTGGQLPTDVGHRLDPARLSRLGGAGTFLVSTDDLALMAGYLTADDLATLTWPGVFTDQYGWGHTGTVDGAKACLWVIEGGRTALAATIAGDSVGTGGAVCDRVVPAVAADLALGDLGLPDRTPPP